MQDQSTTAPGTLVLTVKPIEPFDAATPWRIVFPQVHPDGRTVCVRIRHIERTAERAVLYTIYEPGMVIERHTHPCDQITHLMQGEFISGGTLCKAPAVLFLPKGAEFGPVVAGPEGATLLEIFLGHRTPHPTDIPEFKRMLAERGIREVEPRY